MKWQERLMKEKNRFGKGYGELTTFRYFAMFYLLLDTWLRTRGFEITVIQLSLVFCLTIVGFWFAGYVWDKLKLFDAEAQFSNQRNPLLRDLRRFLKKKGLNR